MEIFLFCEWINHIFGLILPAYVIYLVSQRTVNQNVKVYSKMLITNCVIDILYVLSNIGSMCTMVFAGKDVFMVLRNPYISNPTAVYVAVASQIFFIYLSVLLLPVQFIYRYRAATSKSTSFSTILLPLLLASSYLAVHCAFLPFTFQKTGPKYDQILEEGGAHQYIGYQYYVGDVEACLWLIPHLANCMLTVVISYTLIYVYYAKTQSYLQRFDIGLTKSTLRTQKQMGRVLIIQALYPMIVLGVPCLVGSSAPLIGIRSVILGNVLMSVVHTTPVLNAISIIICVPSYRRTTLRIIMPLVSCGQANYKRALESKVYSTTEKGSTSKTGF